MPLAECCFPRFRADGRNPFSAGLVSLKACAWPKRHRVRQAFVIVWNASKAVLGVWQVLSAREKGTDGEIELANPSSALVLIALAEKRLGVDMPGVDVCSGWLGASK